MTWQVAWKTTFDRRAPLAIGTVLPLLLGYLGIVLIQAQRLRDDRAAMLRSHETISGLDNPLPLAKDAETANRGYLITGERPYLIAAAAGLRPDVILLDIGLPGLNGFEVCERIRAAPAGEPRVIVALTGWGQQHELERSREAGFDGHLVKPVDYAALMRLLASLLPRARQTAPS